MNKIIFMICILCLLHISCTLQTHVNYTIKGTIKGMDGKKVYLYDEEDDRSVIDSTTVRNNSFTFKGTQIKQCFASLQVGKIKTIVILENGIINAVFNNQGKVTGTPTNDIINVCNEKINAFQNKFNDLLKQKHTLLKKNQNYELNDWKQKWEDIYNKQITVVKECINQNLDNIVGAYLLRTYEWMFSDTEINKILAKASPIVKENGFVKVVIEHQEALKHSEIGRKFIDFRLKDQNDREIALSDYIGKGKYVLIDFWASWCGPCREEMPNVKVAYEKFASKGFEIVGISLDRKKEDWVKGIKDLGIYWSQMSDLKGWNCEGAKIYGIRAIPSTLLVDPNGIIIAKDLRGDALEKKLSEIFK